MSKKIDKISKILDIKTIEKPESKSKSKFLQEDEDISIARKNIIDIYGAATDAAEEIILIAKQTEDAKDFMAFNQLLKTALDANKTLEDHARKNRQLKVEDDKDGEDSKIENGIFIGSTSSLLKSLKKNEA